MNVSWFLYSSGNSIFLGCEQNKTFDIILGFGNTDWRFCHFLAFCWPKELMDQSTNSSTTKESSALNYSSMTKIVTVSLSIRSINRPILSALQQGKSLQWRSSSLQGFFYSLLWFFLCQKMSFRKLFFCKCRPTTLSCHFELGSW